MRKEVKLGMAIGGVLLSAGTIYLTFNSSKKHPNQSTEIADATGGTSDDTGSGTTPGTSSDVTTPDTANHDNTPTPGGSAVEPSHDSTKPGDKLPDKPGDKGDKWMMLLSGETAVTRTPSIGGPEESSRKIVSPDGSDHFGSVGRSGLGDGVLGDPSGPTPGPSSTPSAHGEPAAGRPWTHKVTPGENYSRISAAAYGTPKYYAAIAKANPKIDPTRLRPGMEIVLPDISEVRGKSEGHGDVAGLTASTEGHGGHDRTVAAVALDPNSQYRVQGGDNLHRISAKLYGTISMVDKIYELNRDTIGPDKAKLKLNQLLKLPSPPTTLVH